MTVGLTQGVFTFSLREARYELISPHGDAFTLMGLFEVCLMCIIRRDK